MDDVNYFKVLFESIPEFRKLVLLVFLITKYGNFSHECVYLKNNNNNIL